MKKKLVDDYIALKKDQAKLREAMDLLNRGTNDYESFAKLTADTETIHKLIEEMDEGCPDYSLKLEGKVGTLEKLRKTTQVFDEMVAGQFKRLYDVDGLTFSTLDDVYSPMKSLKSSLPAVRARLISKGMPAHHADLLAAKHIRKLESESLIVPLMDLFDSKANPEALKTLLESDLKDVALHYTTLDAYTREVNEIPKRQAVAQAYAVDAGTFLSQSRVSPIRPVTPVRHAMRHFSDEPKRGKFLDFLQAAEDIDTKAKEEKVEEPVEAQPATDAEPAAYDLGSDVAFETGNGSAAKPLESSLDAESLAAIVDEDQTAEVVVESEKEALINQAIRQYDIEFFSQFAFRGQKGLKLSQQGLEEYIATKVTSEEDLNMLLLAMINQAYELNGLIPNIELLLFKMFVSPSMTKEARAGNEDLLAGNIFAEKGFKLHEDVFRSLLETVTMKPKKKHYKKIIAYLTEKEDPKALSPELLSQMVTVGIELGLPETVAKMMRDLIIREDVAMPKKTFVEFVLFLERCKGYEEDAKKFLTVVAKESSHLQIDYDMCRSVVNRILTHKGGPELVKFFEQVRKNIVLNTSWDDKPANEKNAELKRVRKEFFDGLIGDLMTQEAFSLAEIVMAEKGKEKFAVTAHDELIAVNIYAAQKKMTEYMDKFNVFFDGGDLKVDEEVVQTLAKSLVKFDEDVHKNDRLMLAAKLTRHMKSELLQFDGDVLHNLVYVLSESQQWDDVSDLLKSLEQADQCKPDRKTVKMVRSNLVYIFQTQQRQELQDALDSFEKKYFSYEA